MSAFSSRLCGSVINPADKSIYFPSIYSSAFYSDLILPFSEQVLYRIKETVVNTCHCTAIGMKCGVITYGELNTQSEARLNGLNMKLVENTECN